MYIRSFLSVLFSVVVRHQRPYVLLGTGTAGSLWTYIATLNLNPPKNEILNIFCTSGPSCLSSSLLPSSFVVRLSSCTRRRHFILFYFICRKRLCTVVSLFFVALMSTLLQQHWTKQNPPSQSSPRGRTAILNLNPTRNEILKIVLQVLLVCSPSSFEPNRTHLDWTVSPSLTVRTVSVDVQQHWTKQNPPSGVTRMQSFYLDRSAVLAVSLLSAWRPWHAGCLIVCLWKDRHCGCLAGGPNSFAVFPLDSVFFG